MLLSLLTNVLMTGSDPANSERTTEKEPDHKEDDKNNAPSHKTEDKALNAEKKEEVSLAELKRKNEALEQEIKQKITLKHDRDDALMLFNKLYPQEDSPKFLREVWDGSEDPIEEIKGFKAGILYLHDLHNDTSLKTAEQFQERFDSYFNHNLDWLDDKVQALQKSKEQKNHAVVLAGSMGKPSVDSPLKSRREEIFKKKEESTKRVLA